MTTAVKSKNSNKKSKYFRQIRKVNCSSYNVEEKMSNFQPQ